MKKIKELRITIGDKEVDVIEFWKWLKSKDTKQARQTLKILNQLNPILQEYLNDNYDDYEYNGYYYLPPFPNYVYNMVKKFCKERQKKIKEIQKEIEKEINLQEVKEDILRIFLLNKQETEKKAKQLMKAKMKAKKQLMKTIRKEEMEKKKVIKKMLKGK